MNGGTARTYLTKYLARLVLIYNKYDTHDCGNYRPISGLNSVYKIIDYWVIVDTGSTDNTKELIKEYFAEKNIPGELHEKEFVNFGINRTHALKLAKNKADYLFFMDADHVLKYDNSFSKEQLKNFDEINTSIIF